MGHQDVTFLSTSLSRLTCKRSREPCLTFSRAARHGGDPTYRDKTITVCPRMLARLTEGGTQPRVGIREDGVGGGFDGGVGEELGIEDGNINAAA